MTIQAVFENGVFRPMEKVTLPEHCEVEVEIRQVKEQKGISGRQHDLPTWSGQVLGGLSREEIYGDGA